MRDPSGHHVSFDPGDPPDSGEWEQDYCAHPSCGKSYPQRWVDILHEGNPLGPPWPFCSVECMDKTRAEDLAAAEADAKAQAAELWDDDSWAVGASHFARPARQIFDEAYYTSIIARTGNRVAELLREIDQQKEVGNRAWVELQRLRSEA